MGSRKDLAAGRNSNERLRWFRSMTGRVIWVGISWPGQPAVHGYHFWSVVSVDRSQGGVFVVFSDPVTQHMARVPLKLVWKASEDVPAPEFRDYERQWGCGLLKRPPVSEVIAAASIAQATHHPNHYGQRPPLPPGARL